MSRRTDIALLEDIQEALRRLAAYTDGLQADQFLSDIKTQDAVLRNLEIIGEAAKKESTSLRAKFSDVPWKEMAGTRDRLIHAYFGVNWDIVWGIISRELLSLRQKIDEIIRQEQG